MLLNRESSSFWFIFIHMLLITPGASALNFLTANKNTRSIVARSPQSPWWESLFNFYPDRWNRPSRGQQQSPPPTSFQAPEATSAPSSPSASGNCTQMRVRKEWRNIDRAGQKSYIDAVKCLLSKPSTLQPGTNRRRYDDFVYVHDRSRTTVHWTAPFLPWHRHFIYLQEMALVECGYSGALPRWDWTLDSGNITQAPVWSTDPETGFGTNGVDDTSGSDQLSGGSVIDGAFANLELRYPDQHILERGFNSPDKFNQGGNTYGSQYYDDVAMSVVHSSQNFLNFRVAMEGTNPSTRGISAPGPHGTVHTIIGGDMLPSSYAPNDPGDQINRLFREYCARKKRQQCQNN
ncbi:hypothetical protein PCASD_12412 [Puccinia coronata f. sp. avenae]|uniref:Tyrosinase copper-binding domain-containing protein n=1 Tax=Puccinia coronata f. sp. avenae TaxID=200324 RepID=A0A2N5U4U9_9BASI|nr:hypothetical protein PCASD_15849 [Puccinia coronata f. sp. avenae]PLW32730.1 hypothetical protein PCASD_12412 [Puccinia coronata f. sp. avenae]